MAHKTYIQNGKTLCTLLYSMIQLYNVLETIVIMLWPVQIIFSSRHVLCIRLSEKCRLLSMSCDRECHVTRNVT